VLYRLAVVQRARETGFTLAEVRELFFGFASGTPPPKRWHQLSQRKIAELRHRIKRLRLMEKLLKRMEQCQCDALEECGEKLLRLKDDTVGERQRTWENGVRSSHLTFPKAKN
jgi:DNA-binding transcriptional MerR regulator